MMVVGTLILFVGLTYPNLTLHYIVMHTLMRMLSC
jgi:hypothetical protein